MRKTKAICSGDGCFRLTIRGKCHRCRRYSARQRGYDHEWEQFRKKWLAKHPLCFRCGKKPAHPHVDHIIPLRQWPSGKFEKINLQTLCQPCHNRKTKGLPGAARSSKTSGS